MQAPLGADPTSACNALSWVTRAEQAEKLLLELLPRIAQRSINTRDFPAGWVAKANAQMATVEIIRRDQVEMFERPPYDAYWTTYVQGSERFLHIDQDNKKR